MSFASFSTRFESNPARTSDVGLHVDRARTITSSPEFTCNTASPAASYQPHATVFGVGINVCTLPATGVDQSSGLAVASQDAAGSSVAVTRGAAPEEPDETEDGVWHAAAITPPSIAI